MWQRAYHDLHEALLSGCESPLLISIYHSLRNRLERYVNLFADHELDRNRDHHGEHREMVDAIVARDEARLNNLVERYFALASNLRDSIISSLKQNKGPSRRSLAPSASAPPTGRRGRRKMVA
jgi:GntR family carbon starvation induced transcriptional regulator